jgi:hypothetical protein
MTISVVPPNNEGGRTFYIEEAGKAQKVKIC